MLPERRWGFSTKSNFKLHYEIKIIKTENIKNSIKYIPTNTKILSTITGDKNIIKLKKETIWCKRYGKYRIGQRNTTQNNYNIQI